MQRTLVLILVLLCGISFGKIRILTNVSGVEIRADHSLLGFIDQTKTAVVEITPPATLTLSKPGYLSSALPVRDASSTYYVEMIPASYITVNSTPSNAYVIFDNSFVGVTPLKLTNQHEQPQDQQKHKHQPSLWSKTHKHDKENFPNMLWTCP